MAITLTADGIITDADTTISANGSNYVSIKSQGYSIIEQPCFFYAYGIVSPSQNSGQYYKPRLLKNNVNANYNISTGRFTAPVSGRYIFHWGNIGDDAYGKVGFTMELRVNQSTTDNRKRQRHSSNAYAGAAHYSENHATFASLALNAGDYVSLYMEVNNYASSTDLDFYPETTSSGGSDHYLFFMGELLK